MFDFHNSSVIYVSQPYGDDRTLNGFAPVADEYGNGPFKTLERALTAVGQCRVSGCMRPFTIRFTDDYYLSDTINFDVNAVVRTTDISLSGITLESYGERKRIIGGIRVSVGSTARLTVSTACVPISPRRRTAHNGTPWI